MPNVYLTSEILQMEMLKQVMPCFKIAGGSVA